MIEKGRRKSSRIKRRERERQEEETEVKENIFGTAIVHGTCRSCWQVGGKGGN